MRKKFFLQAFLQMLLPIVVPIAVLGILVNTIINQYYRNDINESFQLNQQVAEQKISSISQELYQLNLTFSTNPIITTRLRRVMANANEGIPSTDYAEFVSIVNLIFSSVLNNEYIDSLYLYFDAGNDFFLSSKTRIATLTTSPDRQWHETYELNKHNRSAWAELRSIPISTEESKNVLTLYNTLPQNKAAISGGVLVLNIDHSRLQHLMNTMIHTDTTAYLLVDEHGELLSTNYVAHQMDASLLADLRDNNWSHYADHDNKYKTINRKYYWTENNLPTYGWRLIGIIPVVELYAQPIRLTGIINTMIIAALAGTAMIAYIFAQRNTKQTRAILSAIERARQGKKPDRPADSKNVHKYIMENIVETFIENDYLALELTQKASQSKILELMALQSQINPHFLYNTLESVYWKTIALTGAPNPASTMLENLSSILHYALDIKDDTVLYSDELRMVRSYVAIQKARFPDTFEFSLYCPPALMSARVPKVMLQPVVENSIKHGIKHTEHDAHISITAKANTTGLFIVISDNGKGMTPERLSEVQASLENKGQVSSEHIGLINLQRRIKLLHGNDYGIEIQSSITHGTTVIIKLPLILK